MPVYHIRRRTIDNGSKVPDCGHKGAGHRRPAHFVGVRLAVPFQEEFLAFLKAQRIPYEERYVWE